MSNINTEAIAFGHKAWVISSSGGLNIHPAGVVDADNACTPIDTFDDLADDAAAVTEHAAGGV